MTPEQWLVQQLIPVIQQNNPGASSDDVQSYATSLAGLYFVYILPNLSADLNTGAITFTIPSD